ncbi:MAG: flippase-like domain-containing protein [Planctomycetaceae bacterium]|nr:flippase-like domain-containing protein [Planctomycetaceae bacterium]
MTAGCLAYALNGMDWERLRASFAQANYLMLLPMTVILFCFYALKAWRWSLLLRPVAELTSKQVTPAMMVGFMANNLLPAHLGEFVRVFVLGRQFDLKKTPVLSTVVLERVFDILAILLLLGISLFFVEGMPDDLTRFCQVFGIASLCGVLALVTYMMFTHWFVAMVRRVFSWMPFLPAKLTHGIVEMLETAGVGLESVRNPRLLTGIAVSSIAQWMLNGLMIFCSAVAFGLELSYFDALMVMGVIVFAILMPSPPGYFGVIQACFKLVLVPRFALEETVGCSVFYQISQFVPVTLVGLIFMNRIGLSLGTIQEKAAAAEDDTLAELGAT